MINPTSYSRSLKVTNFWRESAKIDIPRLHCVCWHSTMDGRIATWIRALTLPMTSLRPIKLGKLWSSDPSYAPFMDGLPPVS